MRMRSFIVVILSLTMSAVMVRPVMAELYSQSNPASQTTNAEVLESGPTADVVIKNNLLSVLNLAKFENPSESTFKCVADVCGAAGSKNASKCFDSLKGDKQLIDTLICQAIDSPTIATRKAFFDAFENATTEANFVELQALAQAVKGNSASCQSVVKEFAGQYGKGWKKEWLIVMSGCRIVAKERTAKEEEADYLTWKSATLRLKDCDAIINTEMQTACYAGVEAP